MSTYTEGPCCIEHEGRKFCADGARVTSERIVGYLKLSSEHVGAVGTVTDWHGRELGACVVTARWATPRSYLSSHMLQVRATVDGVTYTGRGAGNNMLYRGRSAS
jgi:hypothetical protein